jgi:site-specific DNA recombinase
LRSDRCAIYARYSTDRQSPASIEDQIRKCREHAAQKGWEVLEDQIYRDEAVSAVGMQGRLGLERLKGAALSPARPFDIILVDDTSRLSRNLCDTVGLYETLNFVRVRVVSVSQGIDSADEQAEVLLTFHGLADSLYVKELAKKTHRGLEGKVRKGFSAGGRTFGYRNVPTPEGVRLEIDPDEAAVVRRIFEMSAEGLSLKKIARTLNSEHVPTARPRAGRQYATWCPSAIREMLRRKLYSGTVVWNTSHFIKRPGTNKRVSRPRPEAEWQILERPDLRIIPEELQRRVEDRLEAVKQRFGSQGRPGLLDRAFTSPYLLTGFLKCGVCGANLAIVTGRGPGRHSRYGCPQNSYRGACSNDLKERQDWIEGRLLADLQEEVLRPEVVDFVIEEFSKQLQARLLSLSGDLASKRERKTQLEQELARLADAVAQSGGSASLLAAISQREREHQEITEQVLATGPRSVETELAEIRGFVKDQISDIRAVLGRDAGRARLELAKHVREIKMQPRQVGQHRFYQAEGEWNLLGGLPETGPNGQQSGWRVRMVAGAGFEPATFGL